MGYRTICVSLLLAILAGAGCGTAANLVKPFPDGGKTPFGGVTHDVGCIDSAANGESGYRTHPQWESEQYRQLACTVFWAADLPLTVVGDVVTWPYTASYSCVNQPVPVPPVIVQGSTPPVTQAMPTDQPQAPPLETLPEPRKVP
jgi:hypothetical protein